MGNQQERDGYEHGTAAGTWVFDGNTTRETYAAILRGIEDGDPLILDQLPQPGPGGTAEYALAFSRGVEDEVTRAARVQLDD